MTDELRDRVARRIHENILCSDFGDHDQIYETIEASDAALAEIAAYRRERLAEFEAAVEKLERAIRYDAMRSSQSYTATTGYPVEDTYDPLPAARQALVALWLEG